MVSAESLRGDVPTGLADRQAEREIAMPRFVRLVKFTPEGLKNIKEFSDRFARGRQYLESLGGKIVDIYAVSGPYDLVAILEAPDEQAVMKHGLFVSQTGFVQILTMPATPIVDFMKSLADVPRP
jgi:uncharacterized protein with GYD domain